MNIHRQSFQINDIIKETISKQAQEKEKIAKEQEKVNKSREVLKKKLEKYNQGIRKKNQIRFERLKRK